jgi:hypothetical protein
MPREIIHGIPTGLEALASHPQGIVVAFSIHSSPSKSVGSCIYEALISLVLFSWCPFATKRFLLSNKESSSVPSPSLNFGLIRIHLQILVKPALIPT